MAYDKIIVKGASMHNLKKLDIEIPRDKLTVITGLSGSGKSTLAFDTIYAEGQRRYVESLSTYARQFLGVMDKPEVESIEGLSPAISIDQKTAPRNPRSTVGTITEIYDHFRLMFARAGTPHCPLCDEAIVRQTSTQIVDHIKSMPHGRKLMLLAPLVRGKKGEHKAVFEKAKKDGFVRLRVNGEVFTLLDVPELDKNQKHNIEVVVDRLVVKDYNPIRTELSGGKFQESVNPEATRLADSVELCLRLGEGVMMLLDVDSGDLYKFSEHFACENHPELAMTELEPRNFSFNSPHGACETCHGLGTKLEVDPDLVIPNPRLSLSEGAIHPWSVSHTHMGWYEKILEEVAKAKKFSMDKPVKDLSEEALKAVLYGTGEQTYKIRMGSNDGLSHGEFNTKYEGVIPNLERRFLETDSDYSRKKIEQYMQISPCPSCKGARLRPEYLAVKVQGMNIADMGQLSVLECLEKLESLHFPPSQEKIAVPILKEIKERLQFLRDVGVGYLSLDRSANTLSGGEAQRIRLATQIGSHLMGVLYVLDEPSIGLHQNDNDKLVKTLLTLRDKGNTVIVVEHDMDTMRVADWLIDIGPGAGKHGGQVMSQGTPEQVMNDPNSVTGAYLKGEREIAVPKRRREGNGKYIEILGAVQNNLREVDVKLPLGTFLCITGVSGSGKSTLINDILVKKVSAVLNRSKKLPGGHRDIFGIEHLDKLINIDQSAIGRTPRSNPATYTGVFTDVREIMAQTAEARMRGYKAGRFSFNVKGGRCESCQGDGVTKIEMHFLPDVYVPCEVCKGKRYNRETLEITYRGLNIAEILDLTVDEALSFFEAIPNIKNKLETLSRVGLGYIGLGQSAPTLSGGEAQRIKLASELSKRSTGKTLYIMDEPTTGLHFEDIQKLIAVMQELVELGNTVLVIEHNLDMIKCADYIVDMGPDGGSGGGMVVAKGTPEEVMKKADVSYTGKWLKTVLHSK